MNQLGTDVLTPATSSREGTSFPRSGLFYGTHPPQYQSPIIYGELQGASSPDATPVPSWSAPHVLVIWQTVPPARADDADIRLNQFVVEFKKSFPLRPPRFSSSRFLAGSLSRGIALRSIGDFDAALVFVPDTDSVTGSAWQTLRAALAPLRAASAAVIELIDDQLTPRSVDSVPDHAGLSAVSWLEDVLQLTRPIILRMAAVPESTFYAWQKNPGSSVRTPTVLRLLRLQAQVGLLLQSLDGKQLRSWVMSDDRFDRLQGDDEAFRAVLEEANDLLAPILTVKGRKRMRPEDYSATFETATAHPGITPPAAIGARKSRGDTQSGVLETSE